MDDKRLSVTEESLKKVFNTIRKLTKEGKYATDVTLDKLADAAKVSRATAHKAVQDLIKLNIVCVANQSNKTAIRKYWLLGSFKELETALHGMFNVTNSVKPENVLQKLQEEVLYLKRKNQSLSDELRDAKDKLSKIETVLKG